VFPTSKICLHKLILSPTATATFSVFLVTNSNKAISGMMIMLCSLFVGCNITGVLDGPIGEEKCDLLVVQSPPACTVTS
jgi:hypothetical protein